MIEYLFGLVGVGDGWVALNYLDALLNIVGAFSVLASLTPNKVDDRVMQVILECINTAGFNLGKARNA